MDKSRTDLRGFVEDKSAGDDGIVCPLSCVVCGSPVVGSGTCQEMCRKCLYVTLLSERFRRSYRRA